MPNRMGGSALIGDRHTAALVGRDGSIDWLCSARFDSGACFAALLGSPEHGRWLIAPVAEAMNVQRRYRDGTLVLETEFETGEGTARIIDLMPLSDERCDVLRIVEGVRGRVAMRMELVIRFDYELDSAMGTAKRRCIAGDRGSGVPRACSGGICEPLNAKIRSVRGTALTFGP